MGDAALEAIMTVNKSKQRKKVTGTKGILVDDEKPVQNLHEYKTKH